MLIYWSDRSFIEGHKRSRCVRSTYYSLSFTKKPQSEPKHTHKYWKNIFYLQESYKIQQSIHFFPEFKPSLTYVLHKQNNDLKVCMKTEALKTFLSTPGALRPLALPPSLSHLSCLFSPNFFDSLLPHLTSHLPATYPHLSSSLQHSELPSHFSSPPAIPRPLTSSIPLSFWCLPLLPLSPLLIIQQQCTHEWSLQSFTWGIWRTNEA